jgi:hypothetical protein
MIVGRSVRVVAPLLLSALGVFMTSPVRASTPPQEPATYGRPATFLDRTEQSAVVHVDAGSRLWSRPDASATSVIRVDAAIDLPVLDRRPGWVKVRYAGRVGWLPELDSAVQPAQFAPLLRADPARLARARQLIGSTRAPRRCGFLSMYTDVEDPAMLNRLSEVVAALPTAYASRFGLHPNGAAVEAVVLFRRRGDFVAFSRSETELARLQVAGFSRDGLAVVYAGDHTREQVAHDLVHEVTHLLNRRVFGSALPPWLEEGMANDLGYSRIDSHGDLILDTLSGNRQESEVGRYKPGGWLTVDKHVEEGGAIAALGRLRQSAEEGRMDSVATLTHLPWLEFIAEEGRQKRYDEATFLIRYLLDPRRPELRQAFLQALHQLADDTAVDTRPLDPSSWPLGSTLDAGYRSWLRSSAAMPD